MRPLMLDGTASPLQASPSVASRAVTAAWAARIRGVCCGRACLEQQSMLRIVQIGNGSMCSRYGSLVATAIVMLVVLMMMMVVVVIMAVVLVMNRKGTVDATGMRWRCCGYSGRWIGVVRVERCDRMIQRIRLVMMMMLMIMMLILQVVLLIVRLLMRIVVMVRVEIKTTDQTAENAGRCHWWWAGCRWCRVPTGQTALTATRGIATIRHDDSNWYIIVIALAVLK